MISLLFALLGCETPGTCSYVLVGDVDEAALNESVRGSIALLDEFEGAWHTTSDAVTYSVTLDLPDADAFWVDLDGGDCKAPATEVEASLSAEGVAADVAEGGCVLGGTGVAWTGLSCDWASPEGGDWSLVGYEDASIVVAWSGSALGTDFPERASLDGWTRE